MSQEFLTFSKRARIDESIHTKHTMRDLTLQKPAYIFSLSSKFLLQFLTEGAGIYRLNFFDCFSAHQGESIDIKIVAIAAKLISYILAILSLKNGFFEFPAKQLQIAQRYKQQSIQLAETNRSVYNLAP